MKVGNRLLVLISVSTIIFIALLTLYFVNIPMYLSGSISSSEVKFVSQNRVNNILDLTSRSFEYIEISSFQNIESGFESINVGDEAIVNDGSKTLVIRSEDVSDFVVFKEGYSLNGFDVGPNTIVGISVDKYKDNSVLVLSMDGDIPPVTLVGNSTSSSLLVSGSIVEFSGQSVDGTMSNVELDMEMSSSDMVTIYPDSGKLEVRLPVAGGVDLREEGVLPVSRLGFFNERDEYSFSKKLSSILSGSLYISETGKNIDIGLKQPIVLGESDLFDIRGLEVSDSKVNVLFEGEATKLLVGFGGHNKLPSALEYLMKNQTLILLINSYILVITFFLAVMKINRGED